MIDFWEDGVKISEGLFKQSLGETMFCYFKQEKILEQVLKDIDSHAVRTLEQIKEVLDDDGLDDVNCFRRIDEIVMIFLSNELRTSRHDFE